MTTSQIESGRQMKRELIDLKTAATQVVEELQQVSLGRRMEVVTSPERPQVWGDLIAIQQILTNLVENALKYSGPSAEVTIRLVETTEEALIEVADTGPGIDEESLKVIFDRFAQVDSSSTRRVGGFGLGLFIVKSLVDGHGGNIEVESALGEGTKFRIHLPKRSSDRGRLNEAPDS